MVGRNAEPFLPAGEGAAYWRRLLNELQMLLHAHPVNEQRLQNGLPAVSSIWPWSPGRLPGSIKTPLDALVADEPALQTLARLAGLRGDQRRSGDRVLQVDLRLQRAAESGDVEAWSQALQALEADWPGLVRGAARVRLWPADGYSYRSGPWRPWRRRRWPGFQAWYGKLPR